MYNTEKARRMLDVIIMQEIKNKVPVPERWLFKRMVERFHEERDEYFLKDLSQLVLINHSIQEAEVIINTAIELTAEEQSRLKDILIIKLADKQAKNG